MSRDMVTSEGSYSSDHDLVPGQVTTDTELVGLLFPVQPAEGAAASCLCLLDHKHPESPLNKQRFYIYPHFVID